jgi:hypothetical protein
VADLVGPGDLKRAPLNISLGRLSSNTLTPEDGPDADDSQMEILHERTLYDLCGFDDDDEIGVEKVIP